MLETPEERAITVIWSREGGGGQGLGLDEDVQALLMWRELSILRMLLDPKLLLHL